MAAVKALFNLKILFLALLGLILIGVAGFHFMEGWPWFDGFYMVLTTITTIGYGELHPLSFAAASSTPSSLLPALDWCCCSSGLRRRLCWSSSYNRFSAGDA